MSDDENRYGLSCVLAAEIVRFGSFLRSSMSKQVSASRDQKKFDENHSRDSGTVPSATATAPTLPVSALPFSREIAEITSAGSSKCQLANVCFELGPTVTEKT